MSERDDNAEVDRPRTSDHGWDREQIRELSVDQLQVLAAQAHIEGRSRMGKDELLDALTGQRP